MTAAYQSSIRAEDDLPGPSHTNESVAIMVIDKEALSCILDGHFPAPFDLMSRGQLLSNLAGGEHIWL